jgi:minor histocompatibility antigen H13
MITVATSLDIPIKLVFPHSKRGGMLGLGDVVLPGIMMALALRFDLYLYYLRKPSPSAISHSLTPDSEPKPTYETATGRWGDRFWTRALSKSALPSDVAAAAFPKVYFYASVVGYVLGMIITLVVLNVFNHAQPALLYLVPGVLIALWGTALFRGELKLMWNYTEAGSSDNQKEETKDGKDSKEKDTEKKTEDKKEQKEEKEEKEKEEKEEEKEEEEEEEEEKEEDKNKSQVTNEHAHHVFLLSLSSPRRGPKPGKFLKTA